MTPAAVAERLEAPRIAPVMDTEIRWRLAPAPVPDLASMSDDDILIAALGDAGSYLELARAAIAALRELSVAHARLRQQHQHLLGQYRTLRAASVVMP